LERREKGKREDGNLAFKCNWNDAGYKDVCSDVIHRHNQTWGGSWCSLAQCRDSVYVGQHPDEICYESCALRKVYFGAGWDLDSHGRMIRPRHIASARGGRIALLTTQWMLDARVVVGAFQIGAVRDDAGKETEILGIPETCLDDMQQYGIRFWDYHKNPRNPSSQAWSTGLFRYVSNVAVLGILEAYIAAKTSAGEDPSRGQTLLADFKSNLN
jgi:hypothetical protein